MAAAGHVESTRRHAHHCRTEVPGARHGAAIVDDWQRTNPIVLLSGIDIYLFHDSEHVKTCSAHSTE